MTDFSFTLVDVGEGLEEAEIVEWFVSPGDQVQPDQVLVSVETAKSVVELPTPCGGVVLSVAGDPGTVVPVGGVLAVIGTDDPAPAAAAPAAPAAPAVPAPAAPAPAADVPVDRSGVRAAPVVRKMARERGVDLREVVGSGPRGRVTKADLQRHLSEGPASPATERPGPPRSRPAAETSTIPVRGVRARIAEVLTESTATVPHIYDWRVVDASRLLDLKNRLAASGGPAQPRLITLLARVTLAALRRHPMMASRLDLGAGVIHVGGPVDLGLAIAGPAGLVVPVAQNADAHRLADLDAEIHRLTDGALNRTLAPADMGAATFTVNNLGPLGATHGSPLLRPGETGAVAFGAVQDGVVARGGEAVVTQTLGITVVGDHRVVDGADLCTFANSVVELVESPDLLVAEL